MSGDRETREFHGLVRWLEELGGATESIFSRIYGGLSQRQKVMIDTERLREYRDQAAAIRQRAHYQALEIARLTGILGVIDEGIIMQSPEGRVILMNEAARRLVGSIKAFWQSELGQMFRKAQGMPPVHFQMQPVGEPQRLAINDRIVGVRLAAINSPQGEHLGTVMILKDVTPTAVADQIKDSFIGRISHELRTPLTSIKGMSDIMLNLPEGKPPKRSFLEAISRNVDKLDRMLVELMDVSQIDSEDYHPARDPIYLDDLTFTVLKTFEPRIEESRLHTRSMIANRRALHIAGEDRHLQWAVWHLIDNAVNYTQPGGVIELRMGKVRSNRVLLEVADTGVGIVDKDMPRIFERFYRGEARTLEGKVLDPRGLGQGLYVAQRIVEAHGGYIGVESAPGEGSTFTVALPIAS